MVNQTKKTRAEIAYEQDLGEEVSLTIKALIEADESNVIGCDEECEPQDHGWPYWNIPEGHEVCQHWIVSDWLARRLAEDGEAILLMADEHYVWCRLGCGYSITDDFAFLDKGAE